MKLNCDLGESFGVWKMGHDDLVMPYIDQANIACGFHASDPLVMDRTLQLAVTNQVTVGAHPGYPDLVGFGRRSMSCSLSELRSLLLYQFGALEQLALARGVTVAYVKPHGALYNDMMSSPEIFNTILSAVAECRGKPALMMLATNDNQHYQQQADEKGVSLFFEAFADRAYTEGGLLMDRSLPGAVLTQKDDILEQVRLLVTKRCVRGPNGKLLALEADTICVHGDNMDSIQIVSDIRKVIHGD